MNTPAIGRRRFLQFLGAGAAGTAAATVGWRAWPGGDARPRPVASALPPPVPAPETARVRALVVLEFSGGNDGLSTLVPYGDPAYRHLRRRTAVPAAATLTLDSRVGLHPNLVRLHQRGIAVVQGVGVPAPDLSHFEMMHRWWSGTLDGRASTTGSGRPLADTGFLGRLCDAIGDPAAAAVGISLGGAPTPALTAERVVTVALGDSSTFPTPGDENLAAAWRAAWAAMAQPDAADATVMATARTGARQAARVGELVAGLPPVAPGYPDSALAAQLALAARLLASGQGIRVIHVPVDGDYDTHEDHLQRHGALMAALDKALDAFLTDIAGRGLAHTTLVMTTSEFGRRPADNGSSGLDHGAASVALVAGPIRSGLYGELPSLTKLDSDDNLVASVTLTDYYATIADGWFGVPANELLPGAPVPLPDLTRGMRAAHLAPRAEPQASSNSLTRPG